MKLHHNLVDAVAQTLVNIMHEKNHAEYAVNKLLNSNKKWGARDRHFVAENIYDIVRNYRLLAHYAQSENPYHLLAAHLKIQNIDIPEWDVFSDFSFHPSKDDLERKIKLSIPDFLDDFGVKELGEKKWQAEMQAMHTAAKICLRVNLLKVNFDDAVQQLKKEEVPFEVIENTIILTGRRNIQNTTAYKNGLIEIQDFNSQKIVPLLQVEAGEVVIDACAGSGGKTLHLAAEMQNKGHIFALDVSERKLQALDKRAVRAGVKNAYSSPIENNIIEKLRGKADKLLIDAPCSGTGVFRRKPDAKFKLSLTMLEELRLLQWKILSTYHTMLKSGGSMLYVTCSIFPNENEQQVQRFLKEFGNAFELQKEVHLSPAQTGFDGFYAALIKKKTE